MHLLRTCRCFWLLLPGVIVGCVPMQILPPPMPPSAEGKKVLTSGACLALGEVEQPAVSHEQFVHHVTELLAAGRSESVARFVRRYPDVALDALRQATSEEARTPALALVARLQDEQCGASGWAPLFQDRAEHPDRYSAYETNRQHFVEQLKNGKPREALALSITKNVPAPFLEVDAFQLQGEALLLSEKPADAAAAFMTALNRAQALNPYWAGQVELLLGEAQRRAGKTAEGTGSWQQAVVLGSQLLTAPVPTFDPVFWERASYLRPASASWPGPVIQQFATALGSAPEQTNPGANSLDESWLWAGIGRWRLNRHEPQGALAACKRAESLTLDPHFQAQMQISQAQALAQLEQPVPAMALLVPLASKTGDPAAAPALALLGGLKLKAGNTEQALALLKKAVEGTSATWPGRGEAEADLGLAYLMTGSAAEGLRWLHAGQVWFEAAHESDLLRQSLENELRYWEHVNKPEESARLRERLKAL